jgi:hypothetical protein
MSREPIPSNGDRATLSVDRVSDRQLAITR